MGTNPEQLQTLLSEFEPRTKTAFEIIEDAAANGTKKLEVQITRLPFELIDTPPRAHTFHNAAGFIAYLRNYGGSNTNVLCDVEQAKFHGILDDGFYEEKGGMEIVTFTPKPHPIADDWLNMLSARTMNLADFAAFVHAQRRNITNGFDLARQLRQVKASTKVELQQGAGKDAVNGLVFTTKIQGQERGVDVELPETIEVNTQLFIDSPSPSKLEVDLLIDTKDDGKRVVVTITCPTLRVIQQDAMNEYGALMKDFKFAFGRPEYGEWEYRS